MQRSDDSGSSSRSTWLRTSSPLSPPYRRNQAWTFSSFTTRSIGCVLRQQGNVILTKASLVAFSFAEADNLEVIPYVLPCRTLWHTRMFLQSKKQLHQRLGPESVDAVLILHIAVVHPYIQHVLIEERTGLQKKGNTLTNECIVYRLTITHSVPFTLACDLQEVRDDTIIVQQMLMIARLVFVPGLLYDQIRGRYDIGRDTYALRLENI